MVDPLRLRALRPLRDFFRVREVAVGSNTNAEREIGFCTHMLETYGPEARETFDSVRENSTSMTFERFSALGDADFSPR